MLFWGVADLNDPVMWYDRHRLWLLKQCPVGLLLGLCEGLSLILPVYPKRAKCEWLLRATQAKSSARWLNGEKKIQPSIKAHFENYLPWLDSPPELDCRLWPGWLFCEEYPAEAWLVVDEFLVWLGSSAFVAPAAEAPMSLPTTRSAVGILKELMPFGLGKELFLWRSFSSSPGSRIGCIRVSGLWKIVSPSLSVMLRVTCRIELSSLWLRS